MKQTERIILRILFVMLTSVFLAVTLLLSGIAPSSDENLVLPTAASLAQGSGGHVLDTVEHSATPIPQAAVSSNQPDMTTNTLTMGTGSSEVSQNVARRTIDTIPADPVPEQVLVRFTANATPQQRQDYIDRLGGAVIRDIPALDAVVLQVSADIASQPLPPDASVLTSEANYYVGVTAVNVPTSDEYYAAQWGLTVIGAPTAWSSLPDDLEQVTVAVIDSGSCANHPDMQGQFTQGAVFTQIQTTIADDFGHGCMVAGIIGAHIDNGIGIAGVAPNVVIMPIRVLDNEGIGTYSDAALGIVYAVDNGAQIINLSFGGYYESALLQAAVDYAHERGVLIVAAAGNTASNQLLYPAAYPDIVAVGSVNSSSQRSGFSSQSSQIDLWAPGEDIHTTSNNNDYMMVSGTSFAAPFVSGVAAVEMGRGGSLQITGQIVRFSGNTTPSPTPVPPVVEATPPTRFTRIQQEVIDAIDAFGTANVVINLHAPITAQTVNAQRANVIAQVQAPIVAQLNATGTFAMRYQYSHVAAISGRINRQHAELLEANPAVLTVHLNSEMTIQTSQAGDAIGSGAVHQLGYRGQGITIAVIDTGVDTDHPDLSDSIVAEQCFTENACVGSSAEDENGHGTHVAGIITSPTGIAPDAQIVAIRVLDANGGGRYDDWLMGLNYIIANNDSLQVNIINLSLGTSTQFAASCDQVYPTAWEAVQRLNEMGISVFASTGNQGKVLHVTAPACLSNVIAVTATYDEGSDYQPLDANEEQTNYNALLGGTWPACFDTDTTTNMIACFANRGPLTDIAAPGAVITSSALGGGVTEFSGTSQASPMAAGTAALMLEANPYLIPSQIRTILRNSGTPTVDTGSNSYLIPLINAEAAVQVALGTTFDCDNVTTIPVTECDALLSIYNSTVDDHWIREEHWLQAADPCQWQNVNCASGHVTGLWLQNNGLIGSFPAAVANLPYLTSLDLSGNRLTGELPLAISSMGRMSHFEIAYNALTSFDGQVNEFLRLNDADWGQTQTAPPLAVTVTEHEDGGIQVNWSPALYQQDGGHYEIQCQFDVTTSNSNISDTQTLLTDDKTQTSIRMFEDHGELNISEATYNCQVLSYTPPHEHNSNELYSEFSNVVQLLVNETTRRTRSEDGFTPTQDVFTSTTTTFGDRSGMFIGTYTDHTIGGEVFGNSRVLIHFGTLPIPDTSIITGARLYVWHYGTNAGHQPIHLRLATGDWNEGTNRDNAPAPSSTIYSTTFFEFFIVGVQGPEPVRRTFEITNLTLIDALREPNHGIILQNDNDTLPGVVICSSEPSTPDHVCAPDMAPRLEIDFTVNQQPAPATNPTPIDGAIDQPFEGILSWTPNLEPDGDTVVYKLLVGTSPNDLSPIPSDEVDGNSYTYNAVNARTIYWRIDAEDELGATTTGDVWQFSTEVCGAVTTIPTTECNSLRALYYSTNGAEWTSSEGWLVDIDPCQWFGVTCVNGHVTEVHLPNNGLAGTLPAELVGVTHVQILDLSDNALTGGIPANYGQLFSLVEWNLAQNNLSGHIPVSVFSMPSLRRLDLRGNQFGGVLPNALGNMPTITHLWLSDNVFEGELPATIGNLGTLQVLWLDRNLFDGQLPAMGGMNNLVDINVAYNGFGGNFPETIFNLPNITTVEASYNRFNLTGPSQLDVFDPDWHNTQVAPPATIQLINTTFNSADITWDDVNYHPAGTSYEVLCQFGQNTTYFDLGQLPHQSLPATLRIGELFSGNFYRCVVRTFVPANGDQKNDLWSANSNVIEFATQPVDLSTNSFENPIPIEELTYVILIDISLAPHHPDTPPPSCSDVDVSGRSHIVFSGSGGGDVVRVIVDETQTNVIVVTYQPAGDGYDELGCSDTVQPVQGGVSGQANTNAQYALVDFETPLDAPYFIVVWDKDGTGGVIELTVQHGLVFTGCESVTDIPLQECHALEAIYYSTNGPNWTRNFNWLVTTTACNWFGVVCENGHVVALDLPNNNLQGIIPPQIGGLIHIHRLNLSYNYLVGDIPATIINLTQLLELHLGFNMVFTLDSTILSFINARDAHWQATQTAAPYPVDAIYRSGTSVEVFWTPIPFTAGQGYYEIEYSLTPGGPYTVHGRTTDKFVSSYLVDGLEPNTTYYFRVRTVTLAPSSGGRDRVSNYSHETVVPTTCDSPNPEADLTGTLFPFTFGSTTMTAEVTNVSSVCAYEINLAAYLKVDDQFLSTQQLYSSTEIVVEPGQTTTVTVSVPTCAAQIDLIYGQVIPVFPQNQQGYGERLLAFDHINVDAWCNLPPNTCTVGRMTIEGVTEGQYYTGIVDIEARLHNGDWPLFVEFNLTGPRAHIYRDHNPHWLWLGQRNIWNTDTWPAGNYTLTVSIYQRVEWVCETLTVNFNLGPEPDSDRDGFGVLSDCNDTNAAIYPNAPEQPNHIDDNCNSQVDEGFTDADGDGYYAEVDDCNDSNNAIHPGASELPNGMDDNCNSQVDEGFTDADGDGYYAEIDDCNDSNSGVNLTAIEQPNGIDDNCNSQVDEGFTDADGDGYYAEVDDCNDNEPTIYPGAPEVLDDTIDQDCDGLDQSSNSED